MTDHNINFNMAKFHKLCVPLNKTQSGHLMLDYGLKKHVEGQDKN